MFGIVKYSKTSTYGIPRRQHTRKLVLEPLEDRQLLSTCHVTRLSDTGNGKGFRGDLRYCINKVNAEPGPDAIDFTVTGTINLTSALPDLSSDIDVQGPGPDLLTVKGQGDEGNYRIFTVPGGVAVQIAGVTISNGFDPSGGAIWNAGNLTISQCRILDSTAFFAGGGIYNHGILTIQESVVSGNSMLFNFQYFAYGGGIHNGGQLTVIDSVIRENKNLNEFALGIISNTGDLTVIGSTIDSNTGYGYFGCYAGGGVYNEGTAAIYDTVLSDNNAIHCYGAAIYNKVGVVSVLNSTISHNRTWGGAIEVSDGLAIISHSTITENYGDPGIDGGLRITSNAELFMRNTIVAGNPAWDVKGVITSSQSNLIGDSSTGSGFGPTDILDVDPLLAPLADNGGPTLTHALLPGSPAIDAGDNTDAPEWDQRGPGFPRIVNGTIDIGAFEVQSTNAPMAPDRLAFLITAKLIEDD